MAVIELQLAQALPAIRRERRDAAVAARRRDRLSPAGEHGPVAEAGIEPEQTLLRRDEHGRADALLCKVLLRLLQEQAAVAAPAQGRGRADGVEIGRRDGLAVVADQLRRECAQHGSGAAVRRAAQIDGRAVEQRLPERAHLRLGIAEAGLPQPRQGGQVASRRPHAGSSSASSFSSRRSGI